MTPTTFLELNNHGIKRLEDGEYEEAAELFKAAFDAIKSIVISRADARPSGSPSPSTDDNNNVKSSDKLTSDSVANDSEKCKEGMKRKHQQCDKATETDCITNDNEQRRKRRRQSTSASVAPSRVPALARSDPTPMSENALLCRPLWLEPSENTSNAAHNLYSSSILYNYAYTLHQAASALQHVDKRKFLRKAMDTYGNAIRLSAKGRCRMVLWMSCHNMQQLLRVCDETPEDFARKYKALDNHKATVLRSLTKNLSCDDMCLLVVSMLGIGGNERPDSPAAAA